METQNWRFSQKVCRKQPPKTKYRFDHHFRKLLQTDNGGCFQVKSNS